MRIETRTAVNVNALGRTAFHAFTSPRLGSDSATARPGHGAGFEHIQRRPWPAAGGLACRCTPALLPATYDRRPRRRAAPRGWRARRGLGALGTHRRAAQPRGPDAFGAFAALSADGVAY